MDDFITLTDSDPENKPCFVDPDAIVAILPAGILEVGAWIYLDYGHRLRVLETPEVVNAARLKYYKDREQGEYHYPAGKVRPL